MSMRGLAAIDAAQLHPRRARVRQVHAANRRAISTFDDAREFQMHLHEGRRVDQHHQFSMRSLCASFFRVTLRQPGARDLISLMTPPQRIPTVLTPDEIAAILEHAPGLKWRAALSVAYGAGLRAAEVCNLKVARHRQQADADPGRARQALQGSLRQALAEPARSFAHVVEDGSPARSGCFHPGCRASRR